MWCKPEKQNTSDSRVRDLLQTCWIDTLSLWSSLTWSGTQDASSFNMQAASEYLYVEHCAIAPRQDKHGTSEICSHNSP
eukprot:599950-Amphidinium_carterae.1